MLDLQHNLLGWGINSPLLMSRHFSICAYSMPEKVAFGRYKRTERRRLEKGLGWEGLVWLSLWTKMQKLSTQILQKGDPPSKGLLPHKFIRKRETLNKTSRYNKQRESNETSNIDKFSWEQHWNYHKQQSLVSYWNRKNLNLQLLKSCNEKQQNLHQRWKIWIRHFDFRRKRQEKTE